MHKTIIFRVDCGPEIGMGHLMRCLTLAEALNRQGAELHFLCQPQTRLALMHYLPDASCYEVDDGLPELQDAKCCKELLAGLQADWLIVDHYGLGKAWEQQLRPATRHLMAIDDLGREHDCDVLLDANFSLTGEKRYYGKVPIHCRLLLGPGYALIRRSFKTVRLLQQKVPRIFLCFGGSDPYDMTRWAGEALAGFLPDEVKVDMVAGYGYAGKQALNALCAQHPQWQLFVDHPQPEALMAEASLAIGAGGTMTWERCAMGLPSIVISIADNQREACHALAARGLICYLGHYDCVDTAALRDAVTHLLGNVADRTAMASAGQALVNIKGADCVADVIGSWGNA